MPECSNMQWFQLHESKPFKSETIWIGFLSYEPIRVLTNSVSLFWRRESKLLRMACKALRTQHSCSTPQCLWGPYSFHPILVPPWMPLSTMHFCLVCLENSFSFPQILPSSNYFSVCLFVLFFFVQTSPEGPFPPLCHVKHSVYFCCAFSPGLQWPFIHLLPLEERDQFSNALVSPKLNTALNM